MNRFLNWLDDRTGIRHSLDEALYEPIPGGARWRYVWGSTLVYTFVLQVITGICLWMSYAPSAQTAWESVYYIQYHMAWGWLVRGIHHYAAQAMVVLLALHLMQVVIDGAYRAPREVNFWLGMVLLAFVLGLLLTVYLLPWDQKGYYATRVATNIVGVTPVIGTPLQKLVQGGADYGHHTLTRFFAMHAGVLPALMVFFIMLHLAGFRRHGVTVADPNRGPDATFWPDQILKDAVAMLAVLVTVLGLAIFRGTELSPPADPSSPFSAARPEWYFLFLFRFLKFEAIEHVGLAFGAIYVPSLIMLGLLAMPLVARWKFGHKLNVGFMTFLMVGIGYLTVLAMWEDAHDPDYQRAVATAEWKAERVKELAMAEAGIPVTGAVTLLQNDPLTQGPQLFAQHCASCHRYNGSDGTGQPVVEMVNGVEREVPGTAADLGNFGSREWTKNVLVNYEHHFAPLKNASQEIAERFLETGDMVGWCRENKDTLQQPENAESLQALVEFVFAQGERQDLAAANSELVAQGRDIFSGGQLANGSLTSACTDCHSMIPIGGGEAFEDGYAPTLTGYGSAQWLKEFIVDPAAEKFYGEENAMPSFGGKVSDHDIDLLVRWMTGDYVPTKTHPIGQHSVETSEPSPQPEADHAAE